MSAPRFTNCDRCGVRLRIAEVRNEDARPIRKSLSGKGYCPNCAITEFLLGTECFAESIRLNPQQFPAAFRLPHVQEQVRSVLEVGHSEAAFEIDWDEVIANWHLPFPRKLQGYG